MNDDKKPKITDEQLKEQLKQVTESLTSEQKETMQSAFRDVNKKISDMQVKWKNFIQSNLSAIEEMQRGYQIISDFAKKIDTEKLDLMLFCLEQLDMGIYADKDFINFMIIEVGQATDENFDDKQAFWDNLDKKWTDSHPEAGESSPSVVYEKIRAQKFTNKLNSRTANKLKDTVLKVEEVNDNIYTVSKKENLQATMYYTEDFMKNNLKITDKLPYSAIEALNIITTAEIILHEQKDNFGYIFISWDDYFRLKHYPIRKDGRAVYTNADIEQARQDLSELRGIELDYKHPHPLKTKDGLIIETTDGLMVEWEGATARRSNSPNDTRTVKGFVVKKNAALDEVKILAQLNDKNKGMELIQISWDCYDIKKAEKITYEPQMYDKTKDRFDNFVSADLTTKNVSMSSERRIILEYVLKEIFTEYRGNDHKLYIDKALEAARIDEKDKNRNIYVKFIETVFINLTLHGYIKYGFTRHKSFRKIKFYQYFKTKKSLEYDKKKWNNKQK